MILGVASPPVAGPAAGTLRRLAVRPSRHHFATKTSHGFAPKPPPTVRHHPVWCLLSGRFWQTLPLEARAANDVSWLHSDKSYSLITPVLHTLLHAIIRPAPSIVRASTTPRPPSHRRAGFCRNFPIAKSTPSARLPLFRGGGDGVNFAKPLGLAKRPPTPRLRQPVRTHRRAPTKSQRGIFAPRKML